MSINSHYPSSSSSLRIWRRRLLGFARGLLLLVPPPPAIKLAPSARVRNPGPPAVPRAGLLLARLARGRGRDTLPPCRPAVATRPPPPGFAQSPHAKGFVDSHFTAGQRPMRRSNGPLLRVAVKRARPRNRGAGHRGRRGGSTNSAGPSGFPDWTCGRLRRGRGRCCDIRSPSAASRTVFARCARRPQNQASGISAPCSVSVRRPQPGVPSLCSDGRIL